MNEIASRMVKKKKPSHLRDRASFHHHVYVVLLDKKAAKHPSILRVNPDRKLDLPCVYVGMTGLDPEERFKNHQAGYKSAWVVKKYGVRLLPELYACFNPMPWEQAVVMERELTEDLRAQGYTVTGGH
jgi:predicted GIY-YIG superfamily endonuclease